ncbi:NAD(P)H-dependent flavin oxidoreductase [Pseudothauera rhizosphaerae]|uniref:Nitronate monooxygenase n=1 Tax=Pseudothauera rhizosphaerae TaxID=2565932 RepID=A0A4S4B389_9RHOO|nr:nitronate monooxygenase [Pseudothauera rhizosphaerae]THF65371.1 nitronate monooxygenase [Pseudothauera rhizosphaerae]
MSVPDTFRGALRVPVIAAPMFLVSGPELVIAACKAGVAGTFPSLNARPAAQLDEWLGRINAELEAHRAAHPGAPVAPYGVNLILHASNPRLAEDLALVVAHRVPFVITSLGHPGEVVKAVHEYGGLVFSDIIHAYHAKKAAAAGVDGIIAVAGGAGGHAGTQSPFSLVREIREFWDGALVLAGSISDGASVRAAEVMGADFAYMGTRFIATRESMAQDAYKSMLVDSGASDVVYTDAISGTNANFLWPSLQRAGFDREQLSVNFGKGKIHAIADEARAWRDVWSAGHGVATIHDVPPVAELVDRLAAEYRAACALPASPALGG